VKAPKQTISAQRIQDAINYRIWDIGNGVLYDLCSRYPDHTNADAVSAKCWLIGRSYAASVERYMKKRRREEEFFPDVVAPQLQRSNLDARLGAMPAGKGNFLQWQDQVVDVHGELVQTLSGVLRSEARSFASKYLHFHRPRLFPIYDSRAVAAVRRLSPDMRFVSQIETKPADSEYRDFCSRVAWILEEIKRKHGESLLPRQVDNLFLRLAS